jgi:solute carrier family 13 (sodium-dependent dicarboxylate transporter), member 2/3/5
MFAFFVNFRLDMKNWKSLVLGIGLFLFAAIVFLNGGKDVFWNSIALGGLMIYLWVFEVIPIYVTALFPIVLAVPLGILDGTDLAKAYGNSNVYLFFGGFVMALALEKWNIHEQIARGIISAVGKSKPRILLGFLLSTGLLSMWISNTATALMMLPMATAIIHALPKEQKHSKFPLFLLLSVGYAASVGGMGTLIGSPPNVQMASILEQNYGIQVDFFSWMKVALPLSITMIFFIFLVFYLLLGKERKSINEDFVLHKTPWTKDQFYVIGIFSVIVILWSFRELFNSIGLPYKDEGPAVLGALMLFILPSTKKKPFLSWSDTEKLPWGILILFGGGLALAAMFEKNGVINELTKTFEQFNAYPFWIILLVIVTIAIFATEIMSNLALVTVFVPLIAQFALQSDFSILQLCLPVTMAASCAFMLPVGTPPNAIVFSTGLVHMNQMAKIGFVLNIIGVVLVTLFSLLFL